MEIKDYINELSSSSELKWVAQNVFSDKPVVQFAVDSSVVNPWLTPDEEGWFTHDPDWKSPNCPYYINLNKKVFVQLLDGWSDEHCYPEYPDYWDWSVTGPSCDIVKWKYAE